MPRFTLTRSTLGPHETVVLHDTRTGARAVCARDGAVLLSYHVPWKGSPLDVTDGFATAEELAGRRGGRAIIMAPWSNRIDNGRYEWRGREHDLGVTDQKNRVILHGFVNKAVFDVSAEKADDEAAAVTFATQVLRRDAFKGYPFDVDVTVVYALGPRRLQVEIAGRNVGREDAPFGCGWHPYFKAPTPGIDSLRLVIPCRTRIAADPRLLPLAGDDAYVPIEKAPEYDFRPSSPRGNVLGTQRLDDAFADLRADADGWMRTWLEDPQSGLRVAVLQERGLMHVYTADTLGTRRRESIALEPVEFMTNAFNRPECQVDLNLKPGASRRFRFGVEVPA